MSPNSLPRASQLAEAQRFELLLSMRRRRSHALGGTSDMKAATTGHGSDGRLQQCTWWLWTEENLNPYFQLVFKLQFAPGSPPPRFRTAASGTGTGRQGGMESQRLA